MMIIIIHESGNENKKQQRIFWLTRGIRSRNCASHLLICVCSSHFNFYGISYFKSVALNLVIIHRYVLSSYFFHTKIWSIWLFVCMCVCVCVNIRSKSLNRWEHCDVSSCWKVSCSIAHRILRHTLYAVQINHQFVLLPCQGNGCL